MKSTLLRKAVLAGLITASLALPAWAQDFNVKKEQVDKPERNYSPAVGQNFPLRVFWGDTHLHTAYSTDAGMIGNTLGPEEAYRFARGETVTSSTGLPARPNRPLDWLVVADYSENAKYFGVALPKDVPASIQERAYTSPIWYTP